VLDLLILDEPTSGLDPLMEAVFPDCIREMKKEVRTGLAVEPHPHRGEALCDRVSIIRAGRTESTERYRSSAG
jgi:ABC-2 type transport system ATP-binding protein